MNIENMIEVLNHFKNGGTIEQRLLKFPSHESDWQENSMPSWSFCVYEYRVKEEPKRVPYSYDDMLVGNVLVTRTSEKRTMIVHQCDEGITLFDGVTFKYIDLLVFFTHLDGTPFGKLS